MKEILFVILLFCALPYSSAQGIDDYAPETIANLKAGYNCKLTLDKMEQQIDSIVSRGARQYLAYQALNSYISQLKQNNSDMKFNNKSLKVRLAEFEIKEKKYDKEKRIMRIVVGGVLLLVGLSL